MSIVAVDKRGRLTLPRKTGVRNTKAVVIPAGSFIVVIPLPPKPGEHAKNWLKTSKGRAELKASAEKLARRDAVKRAKRRRQA
ncbi:VapB-type antitoxin [Candidatus Geothermarchaeota archaeon]|nr:MAG: VapB-type antitoxin [Candidatus Geothermarchaeota archaeon]